MICWTRFPSKETPVYSAVYLLLMPNWRRAELSFSFYFINVLSIKSFPLFSDLKKKLFFFFHLLNEFLIPNLNLRFWYE